MRVEQLEYRWNMLMKSRTITVQMEYANEKQNNYSIDTMNVY